MGMGMCMSMSSGLSIGECTGMCMRMQIYEHVIGDDVIVAL